MNVSKLIIILLCFFCLACGKEKEENAFKKEYEQYNDQYLELDIQEDNIIKYSTKEEVNEIIDSGTGVIYIGKPDDERSRRVVDILLDVSDNTDLDVIYYLSQLDGIYGLDSITDLKTPLVLFILNGEMVQYHVGTIDDKIDLSDDEEIQLYNIYLEGIHEVLQDACDERC